MAKDRPKSSYKKNLGERRRRQEKSMDEIKKESKEEKDARMLKNKKRVLGRFVDKGIKKNGQVETILEAKKAKSIGRVKRVDW
jgi:hypothetical protein